MLQYQKLIIVCSYRAEISSIRGLLIIMFFLDIEMNAAAEGNKAAPPKFKQKESRQFKSKAPKAGQKG